MLVVSITGLASAENAMLVILIVGTVSKYDSNFAIKGEVSDS